MSYIVSLMSSAKLSLVKMSSMDRLLQPALTQQDDWFLYFDRMFRLSSTERVEKPTLSPVAQLQEEKQIMYVTEQELITQEVTERMQETVILADKMKEAVVLEGKLREVRNLEERLEVMDEMAVKLQLAIEKELGKEEVEKLMQEEREMEQEQQMQTKRVTQTLVRKSVRKTETKEGEVDELEDQIKEVFLKGLLDEEAEEVVVRQESVEEVTGDENLLDDSMREKLRQIEKEWQDEVEEKFGSPDVVGTTSVVSFQKVECKTVRKVTIVEDGEQQDVQVQSGETSEERLEKQDLWRKTDLVVERTLKEATERLQAPEFEDLWFILFDRPPYKAVFKPPVVPTVQRSQVDEGEYFTSETEIKTLEAKTEIIIEEKQIGEEEVSRVPEIQQPQSVTERVDDWFVLLDVIPKETPYVPPVVSKDRAKIDDESFVSVAATVEVEVSKEVVVEERKMVEETPRYLQEIPAEPVAIRDDDWFVLLDVLPGEATYVPPVVVAKQVSPEDRVSLIEVSAVQQREKRVAIVVTEAEIQQKLSEKQVVAPLQSVKEREDDWFVLLDVPIRESAFEPPVTVSEYVELYERESISTAVESTREVVIQETVVQKKDIKPPKQVIPEQQIFQPVVEREDDWFLLLDVVSKETSYVPPVSVPLPTKIYPVISTEVKRIEQKVQTDIDQIRPQVSQPLPDRDDDWFVLFDAVREKAVIVPTVTPVKIILDVKKAFEAEVTTTETRTWKKTIIGVDSRQDEARLSEIRPSQIAPLSERRGGDNWFILFDMIREKPVVMPPVTVVRRVVDVVTPAEPKPKFIMEDVRPSVKLVEVKPQESRKVDDDWFVLLDVAAKLPVAVDEHVRMYPEVQPAKKIAVREQRVQQRVTIVKEVWQQEYEIQQKPHPAVREVEDDWFVLLDVAPKKSVAVAERIQFPAAVSALAAVATKRITISETRPQFEKRILEERRPVTRTHVSDDWFVLLDVGLKESVVSTQRGTRPVSAPVFSHAALMEAGIPMATLDQPQTSTPIKTSMEERKLEVTVEAVEPSKIEAEVKPAVWRDQRGSSLISAVNGDIQHEMTSSEVVRMRKKRAKKIEGDSIYIRHSLLMLEEFDKPQEDLLRHHASISELKRNFMEAVPETRPSEWDKRLSTHSPFRTLGINGQPLPSADGSVCISPLCNGSETKPAHEEASSNLGFAGKPSPTVSPMGEPDGVEAHSAPVQEESRDQEEVVVSDVTLLPVVEVEMAQLPPSFDPSCKALDETQEEEGSCPGVSEGRIVGSSPASYFWSEGPQVIRCFQPPLVQTQTVTITAASNLLSSGISTTEVPIVPTKTFTYESSKVTVDGTDEDKDGTSESQTITSETTSGTTVTTTTTHISKVVKSGSSETRVEKRIVITADSDIDQDKGKHGGASAL